MLIQNSKEIKQIINFALNEDLGSEGDLTSNFTILDNKTVKFQRIDNFTVSIPFK